MSTMSLRDRAARGGGGEGDQKALVKELKRCARKLKRTPSATAFDHWLGRKGSQVLALHFGSWAAACEAAKLEPNRRPAGAAWGARAYSDEEVLTAYLRIRGLSGGPPTLREWAEHQRAGEITCHALRRRCNNSWVAFLREMEGLLPDDEEELAYAAAADARRAADLRVRPASLSGRP